MIRNKPRGATVYGIDLGKNIFHVVGADPAGNIIQRVKFRRETLLAFFERAEPALVGMEACPGSQWLARKLQAMGHSVRIIPAQFVKPYVKSNKNDIIDAAAIAEAVVRPTMRFVQIKRPDQVDLQALHRIRDQLVSSRTRLICQMRAFCLEYGVAIRQGAGVFKIDLPRVIADESNDLTPTMRRLLAELFGDLGRLDLQSLQTLGLGDLKPAVLGFPIVEARLADPVLSAGLNCQRLSYCRGSAVFGDQRGRLSAAKGSWTSGGVELVLSATISASSFTSRLNPKTAKTIESRPAAAMAPAPIPTVAGEAVTRPITVMPAPKRAIPRTNKRYT
jgi:Transposase